MLQCMMQLCDECVARHNFNSVLAAHQLIAVNDTQAIVAMFCTKHREQPIRYFCSECRVTLCTICAIEHDPAHKPEALEQGVLEKYRLVLLWFVSVLLKSYLHHTITLQIKAGSRINAVSRLWLIGLRYKPGPGYQIQAGGNHVFLTMEMHH